MSKYYFIDSTDEGIVEILEEDTDKSIGEFDILGISETGKESILSIDSKIKLTVDEYLNLFQCIKVEFASDKPVKIITYSKYINKWREDELMANNSLWILEELKQWLKNESYSSGDIAEICILESVRDKIIELETK